MKKVCTEYNGNGNGNELPDELIYEILTWVPGSSLVRFKCVSKSWYRLITDPGFIKLNLAKSLQTNSNRSLLLQSPARSHKLPGPAEHIYYSLDFRCAGNLPVFTPLSRPDDAIIFKDNNKPEVSSVVGSCHGLLCIEYKFSVGISNSWLIYNPTTRASKTLPELEFTRGTLSFTDVLGFGYDCVSDDYKVLSTVSLAWSRDQSTRKTVCYSLKTDAWESVDNPPWSFTTIPKSHVLVNNSFHWLDCLGKEIKCYSLSTRRYYEIPIPEKIHHRPEILQARIVPKNRLVEVKGQLFVVTSFFDIWALKEYGNSKSWTRVFHNTESILIVTYYQGFPLNSRFACFQDDHSSNFILLVPDGESTLWVYCDVASGTAKKIDEMPSFPAEAELAASQPWVESLVPLHRSTDK